MDAHAYLTAQGWRGTGHSLHPDSDETGLKHHLLIKRNDDGSGLGLKKSERKAEAWWLSAFDQALKGIDVSKGGDAMKQTLKDGGQLAKITTKGLAKYTGSRGLYHSFVRGGVIEGSVGRLGQIKAGLTPGAAATDGSTSLKGKTAKKTQLLTPPVSGAATPILNQDDDDSSDSDSDTKEKKRNSAKDKKQKEAAEKAERRLLREARRAEKASKNRATAPDDKKALRKAAKKAEKKAAKELIKASETKQQRRERRDVRRKRKEEKRCVAAGKKG
ncbi:nucleolar protein TMA23 [Microdochium nivale]|nr:nucleolar protein TMA23 [Microdochium nivale]